MRLFELVAVPVALTVAGAAHAQGVPPSPSTQAPTGTPAGVAEFNGPSERGMEFNRLNNDVSGRRAGPTRSLRPVPIHPDDVTPGSEVRDSKGVVIGTIETVGMDYAVISSPGGRIEIEFASLAKNNKGLLINMPKAKFDALVAGSRKPAK